ncbi:MAG TPA: LemA family protein [Candidatus Bathyarchaeota archaeon]|nr:LemA family protein [Candidatus Bathyarchaeota archaeon]
MDRKWIIAIVIVAVIVVVGVIFAVLYFSTYNNLVGLDESVDEKWAQVEQELQRRYDLIPRVVNASKLYIQYEGSILQNVTELRSQWAAAMQSGDVDAINDATGRLDSAVANLIVVIEDYPDLKASQVVEDLMVALEGTENRISTERMRYNEAVRDYNRARRSFPANLWAAGWGFEGREYFEAKVGAAEPPPVPID